MRLVALGAAAALGSAPCACGFPDMAAPALAEALSSSWAAGTVGPAASGDRPRGKRSVALLGAGADDEVPATATKAHVPAAAPLLHRHAVALAAALGVGAALTLGMVCVFRQEFCTGHRGRNPHRDASPFGAIPYGALKRPTSQRAGIKKVVSWADLCDGSLAEMNSSRHSARQQATAACASA